LTNGIRANAITLNGVSNVAAGTGALISGAGASLGSLSTVANPAASIAKTLGVSNVVNLASPATAINAIGDKAKAALNGLPNDPKAALAAAGVNPSQLAGLSPELQSKVTDQIAQVTKDLPPDADLAKLKESGVSLANIPSDRIQNLPATAKKLIAAAPELPDVIKPDALNNLNRLNAAQLASGKLGDATALAGKFSSAQALVNSAAGGALGGVESALNKVTSITGGNPLGGISAGSIADLSSSVSAKFGSNALKTPSPLDTLVANASNKTWSI
jgi:hypothetical protein